MVNCMLTAERFPRLIEVKGNPKSIHSGKRHGVTPDQDRSRAKEFRDFPRLHVEAQVRIADTATETSACDEPAILSDLSLGGARLCTPAELTKGQKIGIIPFSGLLESHALHRTLGFQVVWEGSIQETGAAGRGWREYGLVHEGSVLEVLNSWLGHLLLRRKNESEIVAQRRSHRRLRFNTGTEQPLKARLSHDSRIYDLTLLDIAPGGLLARGETDEIPLGVHLELKSGWMDEQANQDISALQGCVVDAHSHSGSTFYRVAFDPDSEMDDEHLVNWAESVGGEFGADS